VASARPASSPTVRQGSITEERKRTQRVLLRVRALIHVALKGKATTIEAATVSVNPEGALVVMKESLPADTRFVLEHARTKEKVACRVTGPGKGMPEGFHVPVQFDGPAPDFWKIAFPPSDWRPEEA
jgi:hypothetical protein